jgi:pSer/pThr/pTyr-binding forkhead associated (FHA) protein
MDAMTSGTLAGTGSFRCLDCDYVVTLAADDRLPTCPGCGGERFARASLFGDPRLAAASAPPAAASAAASGTWLAEARAGIAEPGLYLAFREGDDLHITPLTREWTRIGRSLAADVRFDDPTVSRRHALIVRQADGVRVLDDRSLNGVFVNGERVEWSVLSDGDEIVVGRHVLRFLNVPALRTGEQSAVGPAAEPTVH